MNINSKPTSIVLTILLTTFLFNSLTANATEPPFKVVEISECEFNKAASEQETYNQMADTVTSASIRDIIQAKSLERLKGMDPDKASSYNVFQDSPFEVYPILDTHFGLIACGAYKGDEEYDYWFFNDTDYTFVAQTDSPLCNYLSKSGYMATHKIYHHDSCTDISVYRLHDGSMELVHKFAEIETSSLNKAFWGADALYISCEQIHYTDESTQFVDKYLKLTLPQ